MPRQVLKPWVHDTVMLMDGDEIVDCRHGHVSKCFPNCAHTVFGFDKVPRYSWKLMSDACRTIYETNHATKAWKW